VIKGVTLIEILSEYEKKKRGRGGGVVAGMIVIRNQRKVRVPLREEKRRKKNYALTPPYFRGKIGARCSEFWSTLLRGEPLLSLLLGMKKEMSYGQIQNNISLKKKKTGVGRPRRLLIEYALSISEKKRGVKRLLTLVT